MMTMYRANLWYKTNFMNTRHLQALNMLHLQWHGLKLYIMLDGFLIKCRQRWYFIKGQLYASVSKYCVPQLLPEL